MSDNRETPGPSQAAQLELFSSALPQRPYATDQLGSRLLITSRARALRRRYIQANPPWLRVFAVFDIDRPAAVLAWEDAMLPSPLWTAENRENGHAHSGWALEAPVLLGEHDRDKPMRYLCAVEACMRERLQADPSYGGLITKNPSHAHWRTLWGPLHLPDWDPFVVRPGEVGDPSSWTYGHTRATSSRASAPIAVV